MDQKGRAARVAQRFIVFYGPTRKLGHVAQILDVSAEGVSVKGKTTFAVGAVLRLSIRPPDQKPLDLDGKVTWVKQGEMGLRVVPADASYRAFVERVTGTPVPPPPPPTPSGASAGPVSQSPPIRPPVDAGSPPMPKSIAPPSIAPPSIAPPSIAPGSRSSRLPRFETQLSVRLGTTPGREIAGIVTNVSRAGLAVLCRATFLPGTRVTVLVTAEDRRQVRVGGQVVWASSAHTGSEVGVRITHADDAWARLIDESAGRRSEPRVTKWDGNPR